MIRENYLEVGTFFLLWILFTTIITYLEWENNEGNIVWMIVLFSLITALGAALITKGAFGIER